MTILMMATLVVFQHLAENNVNKVDTMCDDIDDINDDGGELCQQGK